MLPIIWEKKASLFPEYDRLEPRTEQLKGTDVKIHPETVRGVLQETACHVFQAFTL